MADRYQDRPFPAEDDYGRGAIRMARSGRERSVGGTGAPDRADRSVCDGPRQRRRSRASRANAASAHTTPPDEDEDEPPAGPPPWMQRAHGRKRAAATGNTKMPEPEYQPSPVHPLHRYAAPAGRAGASAGISRGRRSPTRSRTARRSVALRRCAVRPDRIRAQDISAIRPIRTILTPIRTATRKSRRAAQARSGLFTVAAVLALAVLGTGAAFAYRTFVGSPRSGEPPIIKADNSPTKVMPAPADGAAQDAGPDGDRRWHREDGAARRDAGRRQRQVRAARGVSAAEPERQSAVGRERGARRAAAGRRRQRHDAEQRAAQDQDASGQGRPADDGGVPAACRRAGGKAALRRARTARHAAGSRAAQPGVRQCQRQCAALAVAAGSAGARAGAGPGCRHQSGATAPPAAGGGYLVQVSSQRTEADAQASYRALQGKFPAVLGRARR